MDQPKRNGTDHVDNAYPYKNEISLSIGTDDEPAIITPTPSPRYPSNESPSKTNDQVGLAMTNGPNDNKMGIDNPAYENDSKSQQRPLSSFGHNGNGIKDDSRPMNGKSTEKPNGKSTNGHFFF